MLVAHGLHCTHHRPLSSCARCKMDELCGSKSTHNSSSCCQELLLEHQTASSAGVVVELLSGSAIVIARRAGVNRPTASTSTGRDAGGAASPAAGEGGPAILDAEVRRHSFRVHGPTIRPIRSPRGRCRGPDQKRKPIRTGCRKPSWSSPSGGEVVETVGRGVSPLWVPTDRGCPRDAVTVNRSLPGCSLWSSRSQV